MKNTEAMTERLRSDAGTRWLALITVVAVTVVGCEAPKANDPQVMDPIAGKPAAVISTSDGYAAACHPNSKACGGFYPVVGAVSNPYLTQSSNGIGAYTRTWVSSGQSANVQAFAAGKVKWGRGFFADTENFAFGCDQFASQCSNKWTDYNTCDIEQNEISGTSSHMVLGGNAAITWFGRFSDGAICVGPPEQFEQACDENGEPVDEGGDPANCPSDDDGGGSEGSGIQFEPGEYTDGETVNWETGVGNGGTSVCGNAAYVIEICIDEWDEDTGEWVEWDCGYATTC